MQAILGQVLGVLALVMSLYALSHSVDKKLLKWFCLSNVLWISHYYLIGANMMAEFMILSLMRSFIAWKHPDWHSIKLVAMTLVVTGGAAISYFNGFHFKALLIYITVVVISHAVLFSKGAEMRKTFIACDVSWLCLDVMSKSLGGVVYDISAIYLCLKEIRRSAVDTHS